ncbi:MAG TPA: hypothetical protein VFQ76_07930 [Longimicrobiaceae bacterium]|nr:hypothetical protein [Longimicrobiaceae bacterium]
MTLRRNAMIVAAAAILAGFAGPLPAQGAAALAGDWYGGYGTGAETRSLAGLRLFGVLHSTTIPRPTWSASPFPRW